MHMRTPVAFCVATVLVGLTTSTTYGLDFGSSVSDEIPSDRLSAPQQGAIGSAPDLSNLDLNLLDGSRIHSVLQRANRNREYVTRGAMDARLYRAVSPSVVLIVTDKGLGSGSVIADGQVLTNWHVIEGSSEVAVVFKPSVEGGQPQKSDAVPAEVIKVDTISDLALLSFPERAKKVAPISLGSPNDIEVGADVHAIGHPTGESWTYTKGVISQFRRSFKWVTSKGVEHRADVIQTQTPINPGNSGGPLLSDKGEMLGVNSFKGGGEGLNFAVSIESVQKFIASRSFSVPPKPPKEKCEAKLIYEGRNKDDTGYIRVSDAFCSGKPSALLLVPDDKKRSIRLSLDLNGDGRSDVWIYDWNRDGRWDYSLHASKMDGKIDLIGYHPDGKVKPTRYEEYDGQPTPWAN